jgi:hypothetical protein
MDRHEVRLKYVDAICGVGVVGRRSCDGVLGNVEFLNITNFQFGCHRIQTPAPIMNKCDFQKQ